MDFSPPISLSSFLQVSIVRVLMALNVRNSPPQSVFMEVSSQTFLFLHPLISHFLREIALPPLDYFFL